MEGDRSSDSSKEIRTKRDKPRDIHFEAGDQWHWLYEETERKGVNDEGGECDWKNGKCDKCYRHKF
jgi:hypothetical protein